MVGWLILLAYLAGLVYAARRISWLLLNSDTPGSNDLEDRVIARLMGFLAGLLWPLIAVAVLVTGRLPKTDQEIRNQLRERDARIAELEHELGITERGTHRA
ncbi:hypothetical protein [Sphaerisporangium sp. TRM90804]|uniref:hypothetical protein n=1 Tax=Sphaerisporangium sp. TRM90804 TaxID=3031113 RepID=UPI00244CA1F4|nr:hypothetical protein [Sphaerisporangium sp. TRM90804]MDH2424801.1 hypothetical protein [Sphaerisporangium sp. TRM90804]